MRDELELIVIGDDHVRGPVYSSLSSSVQERKRKADQVRFPSILRDNDPAISYSQSTHSEFTLADEKIRYGIHKYTNHKDALNSEETKPYLLKKYLTVVICIDANKSGLAFDRFDAKITQLKAIRTDQLFNIIPMVVTNGATSIDSKMTYLHLKSADPKLYRDLITIDLNDVNNPEYTQHLSTVLDVSLATPFYTEIQNCITQLQKLMDDWKKMKIDIVMGPQAQLTNFLKHSRQIMGNHNTRTQDALKTHFDQNKERVQTAFTELRDSLATLGVYRHTYYRSVALNILCTMAAIVVSLTVIGAFFVAYALVQNKRYHNHYCKFFATNDVDEKRAMITKLEDHMISTENTLRR